MDDAAPPPPPSILFEPLRLGLMSDVPPLSATEPGCGDRVEMTGSLTASSAGMPMQFTRSIPIPLLPRLTLVGFSRAGCPIDSAIGGGFVNVISLRPSIFFVTSAGILAQPPYGARPWVVHSQVRADIVVDRGEGRSWNFGVTTRKSGPAFTFGGVF
jgi:hypothetical protein